MNERVFTYDDVPPGEQDPTLAQFSLGPDRADVIPVLKQILAINPKINLLASPWTAPSWMKTNGLPQGREFEAGAVPRICAVLREVSGGNAGRGHFDRVDHGAE